MFAYDVMPRCRDQLVEDSRVDRRGVGDDVGGAHFQGGQRAAEKPAGGVPSRRLAMSMTMTFVLVDRSVDGAPIAR